MKDTTATILALCWVAFVVVWGATALNVKPTIERRADGLYVALAVTIGFGVALLRSHYGRSIDEVVLSSTLPARLVVDLLAVSGLVVLFWARIILGGNWSGAVTLKQDHELVQHGPYAYVRHPIYGGFFLLGLGTAVYYGTLGGFVLLVLCCLGLALKARQEERLMTEHFADRYPAYKARVKAFVPFVW
jgi:protein-S-isoprenylcysteine O-methyltransferase Ste14